MYKNGKTGKKVIRSYKNCLRKREKPVENEKQIDCQAYHLFVPNLDQIRKERKEVKKGRD